MKLFLFTVFLSVYQTLPNVVSQKTGTTSLAIGGMKVAWQAEGDLFHFTATAPEDGWVALGFNTSDNIIKSNLYMINVSENGVNAVDLYVVGIGDPKPMEELGSKSQICNVKGTEKNGTTTVQFSIPQKAFDRYHYDLRKTQKIWLICAYSMEDDFGHHSLMRKHIEVTL
ncbi:MAG: DOMON domain-containing protein [Bacteroidota bacterium]